MLCFSAALALCLRPDPFGRRDWLPLALLPMVATVFKLNGAGIGIGLVLAVLFERRWMALVSLGVGAVLALATIPLFDATLGQFSLYAIRLQASPTVFWGRLAEVPSSAPGLIFIVAWRRSRRAPLGRVWHGQKRARRDAPSVAQLWPSAALVGQPHCRLGGRVVIACCRSPSEARLCSSRCSVTPRARCLPRMLRQGHVACRSFCSTAARHSVGRVVDCWQRSARRRRFAPPAAHGARSRGRLAAQHVRPRPASAVSRHGSVARSWAARRAARPLELRERSRSRPSAEWFRASTIEWHVRRLVLVGQLAQRRSALSAPARAYLVALSHRGARGLHTVIGRAVTGDT